MRWIVALSLTVFSYALALASETGGGAPSASDIISLVREFGIGTLVLLWFMWRMEKRMDRYSEQIEKLYTVVTVLSKTVDNERGPS